MYCHVGLRRMMIKVPVSHEEVQVRPNDLQEVLCDTASKGCELTQEEVRSHQNPVQRGSRGRHVHPSCTPRRVEESVQWDAAAQKKHRQI